MSVEGLKSSHVKHWVRSAVWLLLIVFLAARAEAQFSSGSTGADGALDYTGLPNGTVVVFDPTKLSNPRPAGTNVFNFTTITIPAGITVKLRGDIISAPVYWLASGDVTIFGTVDLSGQAGAPAVGILDGRRRAIPGSGGFTGGVGGKYDAFPFPAGEPVAQPGDGPGGGQFLDGVRTDCRRLGGLGGNNTANAFLVPLVGGSGGAGANYPAGVLAQQIYGPGGGAGGGAILIASSTSITINGRVSADGGAAGTGAVCGAENGGGAGGSIRLAAPVISGGGILTARGGSAIDVGSGGDGFLRIEAFTDNFTGGTSGTPFTQGSPFASFIPTTGPPSVSVVSVNGVNVTQPPTGNLATPDVAINTSSPVTLTVQAANIPPGTVLTLHVFSDNDTDQTVQTTPLSGTLQSSTATATVTFPSGYSLNHVKATWAQ